MCEKRVRGRCLARDWLGELNVFSESFQIIAWLTWVGNANTSESLGITLILKNKAEMLSHDFHLSLCPFNSQCVQSLGILSVGTSFGII